MKPIFILLILIFFGGGTFLHARFLDEIKKSKEIRICLTSSFYSIVDSPDCRENCKFSGPIYEEVEAFIATLGQEVRPKYIRIDWKEHFFNEEGKTIREASYAPHLLASGKCDFYSDHLSQVPWRQKKMDFVILFFNRMMVLVNPSQAKQFKNKSDLAGKVFSTELNTSFHTFILEQNKHFFQENPVIILKSNSVERLEAVKTRKSDFTLVDSDSALWAASHSKDLIVAFPIGPVDKIGWAFRKEDQDLQAAVRTFFQSQKAEEGSTLNKIWTKSFGVSLIQFEALIKATQ